MKMRKIISLLLALVMVCSVIPMAVFAEGEATYTKIEKTADLKPGTYYMAAYCPKSDNKDFSENPWHLFTGSIGTGSNNDLYTSAYVYGEDGTLTTSESYTAVAVVVAAVEGKENTYTIHVEGKGYLSAAGVKRKMEFSETACEWVASDHSKGGIAMTTTISAGSCSFGSAKADSKMIRNYAATSSLAYGVYFFAATSTTGGEDPAPETPCEHTNVTDYVCGDCGEVVLPAADSVLTLPQADTLGKAVSAYTADKYYVSGTVTGFYGSNGTTYGNIYIEDADGNSFLIYGLYSADGSVRYDAMDVKPNVGDEVTVYGSIGNYNGSPQMKDGWLTAHTPVVNECEHTNVTDYVCDDCGTAVPPAADSVLTLPQANALGAALKGAYTEGKYYVTGIISEVYNDTYGNMYIIDEDANVLTVYGTYSADGSARYDAMEVKPVAGDTVTVYGIIGSYNGASQMKNGWIVEHTPVDAGDDDTSGDTSPESGDFGFIALVSLMAVSGTALVVLKKKEF